MKKILLTDLDDTLLCSDKSISDGNRFAIEAMIAAGHYFAICTGRSLTGGMKVAKQLGLNREGCYLICYQGNVIYDLHREEVLFEHFMDTKEALELMGKLSSAHIYSHTYRNGRLLVPGMTKELTSYLAISGDEYHAFSDLAELQEEHLYKVISIDYEEPQRLQEFCDTNQEYLEARNTETHGKRGILFHGVYLQGFRQGGRSAATCETPWGGPWGFGCLRR